MRLGELGKSRNGGVAADPVRPETIMRGDHAKDSEVFGSELVVADGAGWDRRVDGLVGFHVDLARFGFLCAAL